MIMATGQEISAAEVAACLAGGGVVLLPTDTVYGLAAMPADEVAVERLFAIKARPVTRNLPVMICNRGQLEGLGEVVTQAAERLIASDLVPGPLTVALGFAGLDRPAWLEGRDEMAFRMPDDSFMLEVLALTGPLFVTSANKHAHDTLQTVAEIVAQLAISPDLVVDDGPRETVPSTLVNCAVDPPVIEREGVVAPATIMEILA